MPAHSKVVDLDEALNWLAEGRSGQWIADEYRRKYGLATSPSMWSRLRKRTGLEPGLVRNPSLIPWAVKPQHRHGHAVAMLRAEGRKRAGRPLPRRTEELLTSWLARLSCDDLVVMYDRSSGWRYVPRRHGVDLDLIREPYGHVEGSKKPGDEVTAQVYIVFEDGERVPFDPALLLAPSR